MKRHLYILKCLTFAFMFVIAGTLKAQEGTLLLDFESNNLGDLLSTVAWSPADIESVVGDDPLASGNNVLKNTIHNYNAAPVLTFVLPEGKTLADYDTLTFKGYFEKGDVGYKGIVAQAYQTKPTGQFLNTDTLGLYNRALGISSGWENISIVISNSKAFSDTIYIALGINCAGTANEDTTTWYADDIALIEKPAVTGPMLGTEQDFETYNLGDPLSTVAWSPADIESVIDDDPLASGNNVLKNTIHNYNAAPVLTFVLPEGKTLADYDTLAFEGYFEKGDVGYKGIVAQAYQTKPTGQFLNTDTLGLYNRTLGISSGWENISLPISNAYAFSDTIYIAFGINCAGTANDDTTTWYADNVELVAKGNNPPPPPPPPFTGELVTNGSFENSEVDTVTGNDIEGWLIQADAGNAVFEIVDDTFQRGTKALKITINSVGTNAWDLQVVADSIPAQQGETYHYSIWAKSSGSSQVNFTVGNYSFSEYGGVIRPSSPNVTTEWKEFSFNFTVTDNVGFIRAPIHLSISANTGDIIYIDNLRIVNVETVKKPVIVEAESGVLGSDFVTQDAGATTYITTTANYTGFTPDDPIRIGTYNVTFPDSGYYNLFARLYVGSGGFNDDSFISGNGFGVKNDTASADWVLVNGLAAAGYTTSTDIVDQLGTAGSQLWKWVNITKGLYPGDSPDKVFYVSVDSLTKTFQFASREDGLWIDKFAFGKSSLVYTVENLDSVETGSTPTEVEMWEGPPLASGLPKFVGNIYSGPQINNFEAYWNQVIPENAGKWGSVEGTRDVMNWGELDAAYALAKDNDFPFTFHVLVWGSQQPGWIDTLTTEDQLAEIEEWFQAVNSRYSDIDYLQVVNEPLLGHNPPDGTSGRANYKEALGGNGSTGWDWVINAFKMAREIFPATTKLMINDFNIINSSSSTATYIQIINLLKAEGLIDVIGVQGHAFTTTAPTATLISNLNSLAATGFPIHVTELDIDGPTDNVQLQEYQRIFPALYEHPGVEGITLWGWRPGLWRTSAYIINDNQTERPALEWLRDYLIDIALSVDDNSNQPYSFKLYNNYPNPFNPETTIKYSVAKTVHVSIKIYDLLGREVATLYNGPRQAGNYTLKFDGSRFASGVYLYQMRAGNFTATKKFVLLK